jgi:hypothetical protein
MGILMIMCEYLVGISMGNNMDVCENGGRAPIRVIFHRDNDDSPLAFGTHYVQTNPYNYQP